jgi:hypothetical protein
MEENKEVDEIFDIISKAGYIDVCCKITLDLLEESGYKKGTSYIIAKSIYDLILEGKLPINRPDLMKKDWHYNSAINSCITT